MKKLQEFIGFFVLPNKYALNFYLIFSALFAPLFETVK